MSFIMFPEAKWLEALKLPLRVMLGIALSSGVVLLLDQIDAPDLEVFGPIARPIVIVLCVVSSALSFVGVGDLLLAPQRDKQKQSQLSVRRAIRRQEKEEQRTEAEARAIAHLDHISEEEIWHVADCLRKGSPSFYTYAHSPPVAMLQGKGLVWTPGGTHHQDHYPFSFHDFVWKELLASKDKFIAQDDERARAEEAAKEAKRRRR